jgi:histidinol phosphatase-like enzyme
MIGDRNVDMKAADAFGVRGVRCDPDEGIGGVFDSIEG